MTTSDNARRVEDFRRLIRAISPDDHDATAQIEAFERGVGEHVDTPLDAPVLLQLFSDATAWTTSYYVDWKDRESTVASVSALANLWRVDLDWGVPDATDTEFLDRFDVHQLLDIAHTSLEEKGFRLWGFDTSTDSYGGWLAPVSRDQVFHAISSAIDHDFYPDGTGLTPSQAASHSSAYRHRKPITVGVRISSALTIAVLVPVLLVLKGLKKVVDALLGQRS